MNARVQSNPVHPAGHALICIQGAATALAVPNFRIQRDAGWDEDKLGPDGWQSSDALLQPDSAEASGNDLVLHVGWGVCRHLEAGVYEVSVPAANPAPMSLAWPDIAPLHAGVSGIVSAPPQPVVEAVPSPPDSQPIHPTLAELCPHVPEAAPVLEAVQVPPAPNPAAAILPPPVHAFAGLPPNSDTTPEARVSALPATGTRSVTIVAACLAILLLLTGGGFYYWQHRGSGETPQAVVVAPPSPPPPPAAAPIPAPPATPTAPIDLGSLSVPEVLGRAPNVAAIAAEGERRLEF